jgi:flavin reductase (DIM6/NTAB) family NADH-FMN oxidoreductase RutF
MIANVSRINGLIDQYTNPILWVVTARSGSRQGGLIATFVSQASLVPDIPRFVVGIAKHHFTWKLIEESQALALHVAGQEQMNWIEQFGMQSGNTGIDKFAGIATQTALTGSPILPDALLWMDCRVETSLDTGDRTLYVAQVVAAGSARAGEPAHLKATMSCLTVEQQAECQRQLARDIQIDAAAIRSWRAQTSR